MISAGAAVADVRSFDGPIVALGDVRRAVLGPLAAAITAVVAVVAVVAATIFAAAWLVGVALSTNPHFHGRAPLVPELRALAGRPHLRLAGTAQFAGAAPAMTRPAYARDIAMQAEFHRARLAAAKAARRAAALSMASLERQAPPPAIAPVKTVPAPQAVQRPTQVAKLAPLPEPAPRPAPMPVPAALAAAPALKPAPKEADKLPLPPHRPADAPPVVATHEIARAGAGRATPPLTTASLPPPETPKPQRDEAGASDGLTAIYDIAAATVYMPDGERLEAHSGIGYRRDNPRYVDRRNRGPTPPNVYKLSLRERLFHGVRAIRLTPVDEDKMFGRDGMLAHTYMLGSSGQSNGCVSFRHYPKFLHAYLKGKVERLVVVKRMTGKLARAVLGDKARYALND